MESTQGSAVRQEVQFTQKLNFAIQTPMNSVPKLVNLLDAGARVIGTGNALCLLFLSTSLYGTDRTQR